MGLPFTVATGGELSAVVTAVLGWQPPTVASATSRIREWFMRSFPVCCSWNGGLRSRTFLRGARDDVQGVHGPAHERRDRSINQPVTLEPGAAAEGLRHQRDAEVTAAARARVAGVARAVVDYLERGGRERALDRAAQLHHHRLTHGGFSARRAPGRVWSHSTCRATNAKVRR